MKHPSDFAICISSYLTKHLAGTRNLSSNTIKSYRDTFCLLLLFMKEMNKKIDRIRLADIDADLVIRFLDWLEVNRGNSASTRNVRLAAIHAFFRYVQFQNPEMLLHCQRILAIPMKETERTAEIQPFFAFLSIIQNFSLGRLCKALHKRPGEGMFSKGQVDFNA